jgi:ATP synthase I chain
MDLDERYLDRAVARLGWIMAAMSAAGILLLFFWQGWRSGLGFALGAGASWLNFRWLRKLVDSLGQTASNKKPPRSRTAIVLGLRYVLLAAAGYAILRFSEISLTAALAGLFVSAAAVVIEILFQLIAYGST